MKRTKADDDQVVEATLRICYACANGEGGECHTPACSFWLNRAPDIPLMDAAGHEVISLFAVTP